MDKNLRFNAYINDSYVKITLKPGQSLSWGKTEYLDEGPSWESVTWEHCGDGVSRACASGGRDCDGVHRSYHDDHCPANKLWSGRNYYGVPMPEWTEEGSEAYDQYAQAAGY